MGIMLIVNRNAFYEEKEYGSAYSGQSEKEISLNGTQEICQEFVAKEKEKLAEFEEKMKSFDERLRFLADL